MNGSWEDLEFGGDMARQYRVGSAGSGVVVFHPWWGLNADVVAYADRLAGAGLSVVAPDLVRGAVAGTIEEAEAIAEGADEDWADAVAIAAIDFLTSQSGRVGTIGFSFGVPWAIWSAAERASVAATVVYYGTVLGGSLARASVPVLGHFADDDPYEPDARVAAFEEALTDAGREVTIHRYGGTGHWFAEPSQAAHHAEAAGVAFDRTVAFLAAELR